MSAAPKVEQWMRKAAEEIEEEHRYRLTTVERMASIISSHCPQSAKMPRWNFGKCDNYERPHLENEFHICHNWRPQSAEGREPIYRTDECEHGIDPAHKCKECD